MIFNLYLKLQLMKGAVKDLQHFCNILDKILLLNIKHIILSYKALGLYCQNEQNIALYLKFTANCAVAINYLQFLATKCLALSNGSLLF